MSNHMPARTPQNWVQSLAFEVALEYFTPEDLRLKFNLDEETYRRVTALPDFRRAVADYRREIDDDGIAFRLRARKGAEDVLTEIYAMAFDQSAKMSERLAAARTLCEYAGYTKDKKEEGGGVRLQIITNLGLSQEDVGQTYTVQAQ